MISGFFFAITHAVKETITSGNQASSGGNVVEEGIAILEGIEFVCSIVIIISVVKRPISCVIVVPQNVVLVS